MAKRHRPTLDKMQAEATWTTAERQVIEKAHTGRVVLGNGEVPEGPAEAVTVRGALVKHLLTGGCEKTRVPDIGVMIVGAWVGDVLDLEGCASKRDLRMSRCAFAAPPNLRDARLGGVYLPGCHVPGLDAQRLKVTRGVMLTQEFRAENTVGLRGARIGGQLACTGGHFDGTGTALQADALTVGADVFLSDGFAAKGTVNLRGAQIGGQLACTGGRFDGTGIALQADALTVGADVFLRDGFAAKGTVNLGGAQIGGQLACAGGRFDGTGTALDADALTVGASVFLSDGFAAQGLVNLVRAEIAGNLLCDGGGFSGGLIGAGMRVGAGFFWHDVADLTGPLDLTDAEVGRLQDDRHSWDGAAPLMLSGFRYARLSGDMTLAERLAWLARKSERTIEPAVGWGDPFEHGGREWRMPLPWLKGAYQPQCDPQPYTQLATVLRAQGVTQGAARVLEERDRRVRRASYHRARSGPDGTWTAGWTSIREPLMRPLYGAFGLFFGYGHQPGRALGLVAAIWLGCFLLYGKVYAMGQMAPNSDVILTSAAWIDAVQAHAAGTTDVLPMQAWSKTESARDYETFSALLYALDLFVPLDALGQERAWAPSKDRGNWGWWGYWLRMPVQMAGWIITAVAAAALTGLVGRRD